MSPNQLPLPWYPEKHKVQKGVDHFTIWLPRLLEGFPIKMQSVICLDD